MTDAERNKKTEVKKSKKLVEDRSFEEGGWKSSEEAGFEVECRNDGGSRWERGFIYLPQAPSSVLLRVNMFWPTCPGSGEGEGESLVQTPLHVICMGACLSWSASKSHGADSREIAACDRGCTSSPVQTALHVICMGAGLSWSASRKLRSGLSGDCGM